MIDPPLYSRPICSEGGGQLVLFILIKLVSKEFWRFWFWSAQWPLKLWLSHFPAKKCWWIQLSDFKCAILLVWEQHVDGNRSALSNEWFYKGHESKSECGGAFRSVKLSSKWARKRPISAQNQWFEGKMLDITHKVVFERKFCFKMLSKANRYSENTFPMITDVFLKKDHFFLRNSTDSRCIWLPQAVSGWHRFAGIIPLPML